MSRFLNNVDTVSTSAVESDGTTVDVQSVLTIVKEILDDSEWNIEYESIKVSMLTGGITNVLYLVHNIAIDQKVIVRVYGQQTENFIDRRVENILFARLSALKLGPIFYGLFQNGRVEGFIDARPLEPSDLSVPDIYRKVAKAVAKLHSQDIPEANMSETWLWDRINLFLELADDPCIEQRLQDCAWLRTHLLQLENDKRQSSDLRSQGMAFGFTQPLAHNDLSGSNLLLPVAADAEVTLIDFEYGSYNYRAYDIAHHFDGNCGYGMDLSKYPLLNHRLDFVRVYLSCLDKDHVAGVLATLNLDISVLENEEFIWGFQEICHIFVLTSHLLWGSWALMQSRHSRVVDFDYLAYARRRFDAFDKSRMECAL